MCENDVFCIGFACPSTRGFSVVYTTTNCQADCGDMTWVTNPSLITNASVEGRPVPKRSCGLVQGSRGWPGGKARRPMQR